ncbi:MAG TPA: hypothetical protein VMU16_09210 [Candidatus Binataceae bacterium]|nr:hypothetical protein [Candidatus Binataceae bacterium]
MRGGNWKSIQPYAPRLNLPAAPLVLFGAMLTIGAAGCFAPALSVIPSALSFIYNIASSKSGSDDKADAKDQATSTTSSEEASATSQKLTPENTCHLMAIERPDLVVVELRKVAGGAPDYRELHLVSSGDAAHWTPIVSSDTGADGWRPAVNFMAMDFTPPLSDVIPESGTIYMAYAPISDDPNDPNRAARIKAELAHTGGEFSWNGQIYEYSVARDLVCVSSPAEQAAAVTASVHTGPVPRK